MSAHADTRTLSRKVRPMARLLTALLASTTLTLALVAPPAHAAPVYSESDLDRNAGAQTASGSCTVNSLMPSAFDVPVVENGAATTTTAAASHASTDNGDGTDTASSLTSLSATAKVTSAAGNPKTLDFTATGSVSQDVAKPVHGCELQTWGGVDYEGTFTVTNAGTLDFSWAVSANTRFELYVERQVTDNPYVDVWTAQHKHSGAGRTWLVPGTYVVYLKVDAFLSSAVDVPTTPVSGEAHLVFTKAGTQTAALKGKAKPYGKGPKARDCASPTIDFKVTKNEKKADQIKRFSVQLDGRTVGKAKTPKKGAKVKAKAPLDGDADLTTVVELTNGKTLTATTSYAACSP